MSQASLLYGVKKFIIDNVQYLNQEFDENTCDVGIDGKPPANCGEYFVCIHPGGYRGSNPEVLHNTHNLQITITFRTPKVPLDRMGTELIMKKFIGIEELSQKLIESIHLNYQILDLADCFIPDPNNKWVEPLRFASANPPQRVGAAWFNGSNPAEDMGIIQKLTFSEALRVQLATYQPYPHEDTRVSESLYAPFEVLHKWQMEDGGLKSKEDIIEDV